MAKLQRDICEQRTNNVPAKYWHRITGIYYVIENIRTKANMAKTNLDGSDVGRVLLVVVVVGLEVVVVVGSSLRTA